MIKKINYFVISLALMMFFCDSFNQSEMIPSTPTGLTGTAGKKQNTISWNNVPGASSYNLYWGKHTAISESDNKITGVTSPHVHTGLQADTAYYYKISAVNSSGGESPLSGEIKVITLGDSLAKPVLTLNAEYRQITLSWRSITGASQYVLYYKRSSSAQWEDSVVINDNITYTHENLINDTEYSYQLTARSNEGQSTQSDIVKGIPNLVSPSVPEVMTGVRTGQIIVQWVSPAGATKMVAYYGMSSPITKQNPRKVLIPQNGAAKDTLTELEPGKLYYVKLAAIYPETPSPVESNLSESRSITAKQ